MEQGLCRPSKKEPMFIVAPRRTEKERRHTSLNRAYQQVNVHEDDVEETAIITPMGLFEFSRMCPGLKNANQILQRYIHQVLEVEFHGYIVSKEGINPPEEKVKLIMDYPKLQTIKELRRFLGMLNFYREHKLNPAFIV
ncbi:Retrovirus-related Pol polyprotein from transposon opus [Eumeta japonica]|uniref:Retrovirus-related Pol polyprotein from transposon opus n=1 Tax=Eumeta variegata TaxID=151549 RepID=A0A4C1Z9R9_EUMVA|nr:Retrovirus-related Pol polyprotein from transposon opus [Eumeta japonica]